MCETVILIPALTTEPYERGLGKAPAKPTAVSRGGEGGSFLWLVLGFPKALE